MEHKMRLIFRKGDWLAIGLVAALAAVIGVSFWQGKASTDETSVQIYHDGQLVKEFLLQTQEENTFVVAGDYTNTVVIREGKAAIIKSDCPGADCVHSGWISSVGRSIVCLPNRVEVRITGNSASDVDFVVR